MSLPSSKNVKLLAQPFTVENHTFANRLVVQPMEGADGKRTGEADELAIRRYDRMATSGAGLLWFEAVAVQADGRANPFQLWMHENNTDHFKWLVERIRETAVKNGNPNPVIIMQATHSGRYSRPVDKPEPMIAANVPIYEKENVLPPERIVSDDTLKKIEARYGDITKMAADCGFDGIDVKACHRYINGELLGAFTRPGSYGGEALENRTRFYRNITQNARAAAKPGFLVTTRVNIYDGIPYPHGFGVEKDGSIESNLTEPIALLKDLNFSMVNISMGNPYFNPHVNRPMALEGVERMYSLTKKVREALPGTALVASAPTFMRRESPYLAAGAIEENYSDFVGFGRMAFAYPTFAKDMINDQFDGKQMCVTCAKCSELMRGHSNAGCVVRDKLYTDLYLKMKAGHH